MITQKDLQDYNEAAERKREVEKVYNDLRDMMLEEVGFDKEKGTWDMTGKVEPGELGLSANMTPKQNLSWPAVAKILDKDLITKLREEVPMTNSLSFTVTIE